MHDLYSLQLYNSEFDLPQIWRMVRSDDTQSELVPSIDLNVSLYICNMYIWIYLYYIYLCMFVLAMYLMDGEERWYAERTGAIYLSQANTSHQQWQTFEVQICNTLQLAHHRHCASKCHRLKNWVKKAHIKICAIEISTNTNAIYFSEANTYQQSQTFEHYAPIREDKYTVRQNKQMWENATRQWHPSILFNKHTTEYFHSYWHLQMHLSMTMC